MRRIENINAEWLFSKNEQKSMTPPKRADKTFEKVNLPHTWNNLDGQDGGMDYYRGACWYLKTLHVSLKSHERAFLEFLGANSICTVFANGKEIYKHKGGFSTFRVDITDYVHFGKVKLAVLVDNGQNQEVYPQNADFTFFGGLYRDVNLITVPVSHFDLEYHGTPGVAVTPTVLADGNAEVSLHAYVTNPKHNQLVRFHIDNQVAEVSAEKANAKILLQNPHLWNGREDPYLYTVCAELIENEKVIDKVEQHFGVRTFSVDPEKGFFLNGKSYPLHGVSRHQDRLDKGWAITEKEHREDMKLIAEVGANTIRLAHYQHSQYFYDLCDAYGMIVWAEIPFISSFMETKEARENTLSQMKELVLQNYNHPSIVCWGISNEITIGGEHPALIENLKALNDLCHTLDKTRLTTMAQLSVVEMDSPLNEISDIVSYNHYFGWYVGEVEDNAVWIDEFHKMHPNLCLGISEYGCEGILKYHNDHPSVQDYSEEYQAYYHEKMLETFKDRPFLWSTHVWNMFDFASDMRDEGGMKGRNNKGLVTFDRKTKKDSFYIYKAYWTTDPFVHLCSKRYKDRTKDHVQIKVYSNCPSVTLSVNGKEFKTLEAEKVFVFENVPLQKGENLIEANAVLYHDEMTLNLTDQENQNYILQGTTSGGNVKNWFDDDSEKGGLKMTKREGYFTIADKLGDIAKTTEGEKLLEGAVKIASEQMHMTVGKGMLTMAKSFTVEKIIAMAGSRLPQGIVPVVNAFLQQIRNPKVDIEEVVEDKLPTQADAYSIYDTIEDIQMNPDGNAAVLEFMTAVSGKFGVEHPETFLPLFIGFTPNQLLNAGEALLPPESKEQVQTRLQTIKK